MSNGGHQLVMNPQYPCDPTVGTEQLSRLPNGWRSYVTCGDVTIVSRGLQLPLHSTQCESTMLLFNIARRMKTEREIDKQTDRDGEDITFTVMCDYNFVVLSVSYCVLFISQILSRV